MMIALGLLGSVVLLLMGLKAVRTVQEIRSSRAGYISFGGDDRLERGVDRVQACYPRWYEKLEASIRHKPRGRSFAPPLEIQDEYQEPVMSDAPLLARIVISRKDQTILLLGNHVYLGGYLLAQFVQLVFCKEVCKQVFPRNRYLPLLTELMMLTLFGRLLLRPAHAQSRIFDDKAEIRRYYLQQDLAAIEAKAASLGMHHLYLVIASHVFLVMRRMKKDRLRVSLPVSFEDETSFNTVGAVFLDLSAEPDLESMARKIRRLVKRSQWQASASNHIQRIFPTRKLSERARNLVDLTLTVVPQKTLPGNLLSTEMKTYQFSMDNIQYPVYAMAFIFEGQVHSSFMINTPDYDVGAFLAEDGAAPLDLRVAREGRTPPPGPSPRAGS